MMIQLLGSTAILMVSGFVVLYSQIPRYRRYWHKLAVQSPPPGALIYAALGDSAGQGIGATRPQKSYVGLMAQALEQRTGRPVHVVNLSVSGAKLADCVRQQLPQLKLIKPDLVTIEIGANDMIAWDEASFAEDMKTLLRQVPEHTIVSDIPYFGGGRYKRYEPHVQVAGRVIRGLAERYDIQVAPLYESTRKYDGLQTMAIDILHPSNRGYQNWFNAFWQVAGEHYKRGDTSLV
jgi:lysophospholipase L1-like esterase